MLWINQRNVTDYDGSRHVEHDVHITRGDSGYLELVPVQNGSRSYSYEFFLDMTTKTIIAKSDDYDYIGSNGPIPSIGNGKITIANEANLVKNNNSTYSITASSAMSYYAKWFTAM